MHPRIPLTQYRGVENFIFFYIFLSPFNFLISKYTIFLIFIFFLLPGCVNFYFWFGGSINEISYISNHVCAGINIWVSVRYRFLGIHFSIQINQMNKWFLPVVIIIPKLLDFSFSFPTIGINFFIFRNNLNT